MASGCEPQPLSQIVKGRDPFAAEKAEGFRERGTAGESTRNESVFEAAADACAKRPVEVAACGGCRDDLLQAIAFGSPGLPEGFAVPDCTGFKEAPKDDECTDFEDAGETRGGFVEWLDGIQFAAEVGHRYENLGCDLIAPALGSLVGESGGFGVGQRRLSECEMREFVGEGEHLTGFGVGAVDEDERSGRVCECKTAKLRGVELAVGVVADDAAHHYENSSFFGPVYEETEGFGPCADFATAIQIEVNGIADGSSSVFDGHLGGQGADQCNWGDAFFAGEFLKPSLAGLAEVDGIEQVPAGLAEASGLAGTEVWNREGFRRGRGQEERTERRVGGLRELLELLQCWSRLSSQPCV